MPERFLFGDSYCRRDVRGFAGTVAKNSAFQNLLHNYSAVVNFKDKTIVSINRILSGSAPAIDD